ncbi:hypothetical protein [Allomuricauda sp. SCSIO 65647]|nr:hypothetical protein [Muricauda sp. SCSIO 65647]UJH67254.1 hypothetical protein L0P89_15045 [Muricauda sp. SCSIO 65647]
MEKRSKNRPEPIPTVKVYSKNETVFTKDEQENWMPIHFNWIPIHR